MKRTLKWKLCLCGALWRLNKEPLLMAGIPKIEDGILIFVRDCSISIKCYTNIKEKLQGAGVGSWTRALGSGLGRLLKPVCKDENCAKIRMRA